MVSMIALFLSKSLSDIFMIEPFMLLFSFVMSCIPSTKSRLNRFLLIYPLSPTSLPYMKSTNALYSNGLRSSISPGVIMKLSNSPFSLHIRWSLKQLLKQKPAGRTLAYVGDGINDAPVLKRADVGIAMGALGCDAAIEAADVVLMDDEPRKVPLAVHIARRTIRIAHQNVALAIGVKVAVLLLATVGLGTMWMAVFADVGVTVLAVLNAMRALKKVE